jgi:hypothetical protein
MAEVQELENEEVGELEAVEEEIQTAQVEPAAVEDDDIPEQFRGKSPKEIAKYAAAMEKRLSKQGQELGDVRKLADDLLRSQLLATKQPEAEAPKEVDFFENPQEAIRKAVESNPRVQAAEQYAIQAQREMARNKFIQMHPDATEIVHDQGFVDWVKGSRVRQQLFQAAENYDLEAANELLSTFKELRSVKQQKTVEVDTKARDQAMKAAAVETNGSGESSKKVYRRSDLIRLKIKDPARYESMQDEIYAAYTEGRVR